VALADPARAAAHVDAYGRLADDTRLAAHRWRTPLMRAMLLGIEGRFAEAAAFVEEAEGLARESGDRESQRALATHRFSVATMRGDVAEMRAGLPRVLRTWSDATGGVDVGIACEAVVAALEEDAEATSRLLARLDERSVLWSGDVSVQAMVVPALAFAGDEALVARVFEKMRPDAGTFLTTGMSGYAWMGVGALPLGRLAAALGRWLDADALFAQALALVAPIGARPTLVNVRHEWARALLARGRAEDRARARGLLDEAASDARALGMTAFAARLDARRAELAGATSPVPAGDALRLRSEGEYWSVEWGGGAPVRLRDSRGLQILAALIASPGREIHALDLTTSAASGEGVAADAGDAGELLDEDARAAYRQRLEELRETLSEAEAFGDAGRRERAQSEIEALTAELSRAVGLGGRARRAGSAAERARVAVQRRVKDALARINEAAPSLGQHLGRTIYTGAFCSYRPDEPRRPR
jgi:hypothetical protein